MTTYEVSYMYRKVQIEVPSPHSLQSAMDSAAARLGFHRAELRGEEGRVSLLNRRGEKFRGNYRKL